MAARNILVYHKRRKTITCASVVSPVRMYLFRASELTDCQRCGLLKTSSLASWPETSWGIRDTYADPAISSYAQSVLPVGTSMASIDTSSFHINLTPCSYMSRRPVHNQTGGTVQEEGFTGRAHKQTRTGAPTDADPPNPEPAVSQL